MMPRLAERAAEVTAAQRARGLDSEGSLRAAPAGRDWPWPGRRCSGAIDEAEARALALESRGFTRPGRHTLLWAPADSAAQRLARWALLPRSPSWSLLRLAAGGAARGDARSC